MSDTLTLSQQRVLRGVTTAPRSTAQVSDALGFPRRATARANVSTVLAGLARLGLVEMANTDRGVTWTLVTAA